MIRRFGNVFLLNTDNTSYMFHVLDSGHIEHLYYGRRLLDNERSDNGATVSVTAEALREKHEFAIGNGISYSKEYQNLSLEDICLEMSSRGKGDIREPFISLEFSDGSSSCDFLYSDAEIKDGKDPLADLPSSYASDKSNAQSLIVILKERYQEVFLELKYSVFEECDVITRSARLVNKSASGVKILRLMSTQLDLQHCGLKFTTFNGHWAREMQRKDVTVTSGNAVNSSVCGVSGNRANPFVMLSDNDCSEDHGDCFGFNLVYSGNHMESVSVSGFDKTRFLCGINPDGFEWYLEPGGAFEAPEAIMTFASEGYNALSENMHIFIQSHIVRGKWKDRERPILINSWEAAYFKFSESSLLKLARTASDAGIELFVLDDGWFGTRDDDHSSLGDWKVNTKKLPGGLKRLSEKINQMGMKFGIWVEPEMINENSDLYRAHPDWAVNVDGREQSLGRDQMILDLTRKDVQDNIISQMEDVFRSGNIEYVKWDMNRIFTDCVSIKLPADRQREFFHRYVLGLYRLMDTLTKEFPDILFEGCASGGNRFDPGILCYFPQIWGSDDTDAMMRRDIQRGYSYGYPQSCIGSHVSACPNHQTMRSTPIETRFAVAACGAFGYELNINEVSGEDLAAVKEQTGFYKKWRKVFQFGNYFRLSDSRWIIVSADRKLAVGIMIQDRMIPNSFFDEFRTEGLDESLDYRVTVRAAAHDVSDFGSLINMMSPVHIKQEGLMHQVVRHFVKISGEKEDISVPGSVLNSCGLRLKMRYGGTGYNENTRIMKDFDSRIYLFEAKS